jgi:hypothetical protein
MRWIQRLLTVVAVLAGSVVVAVPAAGGDEERISAYEVELTVDGAGDLQVTERIEYDFGSTERHGIVRSIPVRFRYDATRDRLMPITVRSVRATPGTPDQYTEERTGPNLDIRIGDPNRTVTGRHGYTIVYSVDGALNRIGDNDELYWNAVGVEWRVPIDRATARVSTPLPISRAACYAGPRGSRQACAEHRIAGRTASFDESGLAAAEGLTVVVAFPAGAVPRPQPVLTRRWSAAEAFAVTPLTAALFGALCLLAALSGWLLLRRRPDRRSPGPVVLDRAVASTEWRPPDGLPPALLDLLAKRTVRPVAISATIVDLAARGYLSIEPIGKHDWRLVERHEPDDALRPFERRLMAGLFHPQGGRPRPAVMMSTLTDRFTKAYATIRDALYDEAVDRGWFVGRPDRYRRRAMLVGGLTAAVGIALTAAAARWTRFGVPPIPVALAGLALVIGVRGLPRRTEAGDELARRAVGFREYLRLTALAPSLDGRPPRYRPEVYAGYAMAFGLTALWSQAVALSHAGGWGADPHPYLPASVAERAGDFSRSWGTALGGSSSSGFSGSSGGGGGGGGGGSW